MPVIKLERQWGVPLYYMTNDMRMVQELNGQKKFGQMVNGKFVPDKTPSV